MIGRMGWGERVRPAGWAHFSREARELLRARSGDFLSSGGRGHARIQVRAGGTVKRDPLDHPFDGRGERWSATARPKTEELLMRKATQGHPPGGEERRRNHTISRMRVRVGHVFAKMKQMGRTYAGAPGWNGPASTTTSQSGLRHGPLCLPGPPRAANPPERGKAVRPPHGKAPLACLPAIRPRAGRRKRKLRAYPNNPAAL